MTAPILIVSGAGLVGSHLRAVLADRDSVATYHRVPVPGGVSLDVTDSEAVRRLVHWLRPSAVLVAAAEPHVERCEREPEATRRINVDAIRPIARACAEVGATVVVFSSEYVFEGTRGAYGEDDPTGPINEYGRQKVELEAIARAVPRHLICRTSGVFGWDATRKNFVCRLVDQLRRAVPFDVPANQMITPTYAPDLASAVAALLDGDHTGTFHVCGPAILDRLTFARLVARTFGLPEALVRGRPTADLGLLAPRPLRCGLSDAKLRATLPRGLRPPPEALAALREAESAS